MYIKNSECKLSWGRGSALVKVSGGQVQAKGHNICLPADTKRWDKSSVRTRPSAKPNCQQRQISGKSPALGLPGPAVPRVERRRLLTEQAITLLDSNLENKTRHTFFSPGQKCNSAQDLMQLTIDSLHTGHHCHQHQDHPHRWQPLIPEIQHSLAWGKPNLPADQPCSVVTLYRLLNRSVLYTLRATVNRATHAAGSTLCPSPARLAVESGTTLKFHLLLTSSQKWFVKSVSIKTQEQDGIDSKV